MRNEVAQIDQRVAKLNAEKAELEASIVQGGLSGPQMAETGRRLNHIAAEVSMNEERWLELTTEIEQIEGNG